MDAARRRRLIQLGIVGVVLAAVVFFVVLPALDPPTAAVERGPARGGRPAAAAKRPTGGPVDVKLDALGRAVAAPDAPEGPRRNPFRMGPATPPPAPEGTQAARIAKPVVPIAPVETGPPQPPPPPPIPYRFIGVLAGVPGQGRIAVLTDGRLVLHGRVNEVIEGRYRIVQIGEESLQIEHADGRGRQTLRLLGK